MAEQRLCQGHVAGGGEPSPASGGVCGSDHTGQRTPAVAQTGRYTLLCVSECVHVCASAQARVCVCVCGGLGVGGLSVREDSCCVSE